MTRGAIDQEKAHLNLARIDRQGNHFEVAVDPDLAVKMKKGEEVSIHEVMKSEHVFKDAKKGLLASEEDLREFFGTEEPTEVGKKIIEKGEIQLSAEYRHEIQENKKKQIINMIHKAGYDPKTGLPHPLTRIENAMDEANVRIDPHKPAKEQLNDILDKLRPIIPISTELKEIQLKVPAQFTGKAYSTIKNLAKVKKEDWNSDGSLSVLVEVTAAVQQELLDKLNSMTHGNIESKIVK